MTASKEARIEAATALYNEKMASAQAPAMKLYVETVAKIEAEP